MRFHDVNKMVGSFLVKKKKDIHRYPQCMFKMYVGILKMGNHYFINNVLFN